MESTRPLVGTLASLCNLVLCTVLEVEILYVMKIIIVPFLHIN